MKIVNKSVSEFIKLAYSLRFSSLALGILIASTSMHATAFKVTDQNQATEQAQSTQEKPAQALSFEQITQRYIEDPSLLGESRFKVMFFKIYDAKLSAPKGQWNKTWNKDTPLALSLTYLRDFDGEDIASRSVDEMRDIGYTDEVTLAKWFEQMRSVFPNVKEGENITGVLDNNKHTHFYYEGQLVGSIEDVVFGESFFGIWLNEKTSEPKMREQLLGL